MGLGRLVKRAISSRYAKRGDSGRFLFYSPGNNDGTISVVTANVGMGNLKWARTIGEQMVASGYEGRVAAETADDEWFGSRWLSEKFLRSAHRKMAHYPTYDYNSLEGYLKSRGEIGIKGRVKNLLGGEAVFSFYAEKMIALATSGERVSVVATQELPLVVLNRHLKVHNAVRRVLNYIPCVNIDPVDMRLAINLPDVHEKPGVRHLAGSLDAVLLNQTFDQPTGYGGFLPEYKKKPEAGAIVKTLTDGPIVRHTPLPGFVAKRRGADYRTRWAEIDDIVDALSHGREHEPVKISMIPSGSGISLIGTETMLTDMQDYLKNGRMQMCVLGTSEEHVAVIREACGDYGIDFHEGSAYNGFNAGVTVFNNENTTIADKVPLIDGSYKILLDSHVMIAMPGEQPTIADALGVASVLGLPRGYNEVNNALRAVDKGTAVYGWENVAETVYGLFKGQEPKILEMRAAFESHEHLNSYGLTEPDGDYQTGAFAHFYDAVI